MLLQTCPDPINLYKFGGSANWIQGVSGHGWPEMDE